MGMMSKQCGLPTDEIGILKYLVWGEELAKFGNDQSFIIQVMMGVFLLTIFGTLRAVEMITGPAWAPIAIAFVGALIVRNYRRKISNKTKKA